MQLVKILSLFLFAVAAVEAGPDGDGEPDGDINPTAPVGPGKREEVPQAK